MPDRFILVEVEVQFPMTGDLILDIVYLPCTYIDGRWAKATSQKYEGTHHFKLEPLMKITSKFVF